MEYTKNEQAILLLDSITGISLGKKHKILRSHENPSDIFDNMNKEELETFLKEDQIKKLGILNIPIARNLCLQEIENLNCSVSTLESDDYPEKLKEIYDPPLCLFYRGNLKLFDSTVVLITGTRYSSIYGKDVCKYFIEKLAERDIIFASGTADGIDRDVLDGVHENQARLILVTPGGIDKIVPSVNKDICESMEKNGLILSEHRPSVSPQRFHYTMRNRVLAASSTAMILVEADENSGSLDIATISIEYGKEVFAIPGSIFAKGSKGTNNLIAQGNAVALIDEKQIFDVLRMEYSFTSQTKSIELDDMEERILECVENGDCHIAQIMAAIAISSTQLISKLMVLEAKGILVNIGGNKYQKKNY